MINLQRGYCMNRPDIKLLEDSSSLIASNNLWDSPSNDSQMRVALISGGGSGHEPAHSGYIGAGGLSAVVCGQVYSSPTRDAIFSTISALKNKEVVMVVKNYTGDRINFGWAAELAQMALNKTVKTIVVADDVALLETQSAVGARGIAGTVFVHKIAGSIASTGSSIDEVVRLGEKVAESVKTFGISLSSCTLPSSKKRIIDIPEGHMEVGLGIHGEKGLGSKPIEPASEIVRLILSKLLPCFSASQRDIAVLLNNLGSTTHMEMAVVTQEVFNQLRATGKNIIRFYCGQALTAMETSGISISILPIDDEILHHLDSPTMMPAWNALGTGKISESILAAPPPTSNFTSSSNNGFKDSDLCHRIKSAMKLVAEMLVAKEAYLTDLDSQVGDGDLGTNLAISSNDLISKIDSWDSQFPALLLSQLAIRLGTTLGGTSGPLYSVFFLEISKELSKYSSSKDVDWSQCLKAGSMGISRIGGANLGDRTMLDALLPAIDAFCISSDLNIIAAKAREGSESTSKIQAKRGRSSYLGARVLGIVDPGSAAVALIISTICENWHSNQ